MKESIKLFDIYLKDSGLKFEAIIIGGAALNILDVTSRVTRDVDFIDPEIPHAIKDASIKFALDNSDLNLDPENWINNGPISIINDLDFGWRLRLQKIFHGTAITLYTLGRTDLLKTKLCAYCDRELDFDDCVALRPTIE